MVHNSKGIWREQHFQEQKNLKQQMFVSPIATLMTRLEEGELKSGRWWGTESCCVKLPERASRHSQKHAARAGSTIKKLQSRGQRQSFKHSFCSMDNPKKKKPTTPREASHIALGPTSSWRAKANYVQQATFPEKFRKIARLIKGEKNTERCKWFQQGRQKIMYKSPKVWSSSIHV